MPKRHVSNALLLSVKTTLTRGVNQHQIDLNSTACETWVEPILHFFVKGWGV